LDQDDISLYSSIKDSRNVDPKELNYFKQLEDYFNNSIGTTIEKLQNFSKYVPRQDLTRFLVRYELFKKILNLQGSIIECGVLHGGGLMTFAQFSAIHEHLNHQRKIIGFDTFKGFPNTSEFDNPDYAQKGKLATNSFDDLKKCIELFDMNRFLNFSPKVELIKGNMSETVPKYLKDNPQTIVSLLFLDVDIYEPTKIALEYFVPRMPKGSIIAFDELNDKAWPGETKALFDTIGIHNFKIQRFTFDTKISYIVLDEKSRLERI